MYNAYNVTTMHPLKPQWPSIATLSSTSPMPSIFWALDCTRPWHMHLLDVSVFSATLEATDAPKSPMYVSGNDYKMQHASFSPIYLLQLIMGNMGVDVQILHIVHLATRISVQPLENWHLHRASFASLCSNQVAPLTSFEHPWSAKKMASRELGYTATVLEDYPQPHR